MMWAGIRIHDNCISKEILYLVVLHRDNDKSLDRNTNPVLLSIAVAAIGS